MSAATNGHKMLQAQAARIKTLETDAEILKSRIARLEMDLEVIQGAYRELNSNGAVVAETAATDLSEVEKA